MSGESSLIKVREEGQCTVVRFAKVDRWDDESLCAIWEEVDALVNARKLKTLAFDLHGVDVVPNEVLSVLASMWNKGLGIRLVNLSAFESEKLIAKGLHRMFEIAETQ